MMTFFSSLWQKIPWSDVARLSGLGFVFLSIVLGVAMVPLGLPGTWVIVLGSVTYSFFFTFDGGASSPWAVNAILIGIAVVGEIVEFFVGTLGSKPLKVSNGAIVCAFIGGIVGAIIGVPVFLIGSMIGLFIGAFLGAFIWELATLGKVGRALTNALAVLATKVVATFLKTTLALVMAFYLLFKLF
ncbi:MAG TPA: DUF456 domain-containing protein [bacterium]|nr:DUF456 domain-containing protein [bacterium]